MPGATLLEVIRRAAVQAVQAAQPADVLPGTVGSASPLKIRVGHKLELSGKRLLVPRHLTEYTVSARVSGLDGVRQITVQNALREGETVLLLRKAGGQTFIILDREAGS